MMRTHRPPVPEKSSDVVDAIFGSVTGIPNYRTGITERQPPTVQGDNALMLAKHIIVKAKTQPVDADLLARANFFKDQWDSGTCYLCGLPILEGDGQEEQLEHILPIGLALGLLGIISETFNQFRDRLVSNTIGDDESLSYLLEYSRSHACCNQIKSRVLKFSCFFM